MTEKARRRLFTVEYKRQDREGGRRLQGVGRRSGALLRREGLYSSHLTTWRAARDRGELAPGAASEEAWPAGDRARPARQEASPSSSARIARLTRRAERAEAIVEIQKKVAALLGRPFPSEES